MKKELQISFLLPCYNVEKYVEECIESIMKQGIEDFEIICVDDCSTDNTYSVLCDLAEKNAKVTVLKNIVNSGVSYTRNVALRAACGKYVWFVDPDDLLYPEAAKILLSATQNGEADYIAGNYLEYDDSFGVKDLDCLPTLEYPASIQSGVNYIPACTNQNGAIAGSVCVGIRRRSFLLNNNLFFNEEVHMTEDVLFNFLCERHSRFVVKLEINIYVYRVREYSATTAKTAKAIEKTVSSAIKLIQVYQSFIDKVSLDELRKIQNRILFLRENCLLNLTQIRDKSIVKKYLKRLKDDHLYPWRRSLGRVKGFRCLNTRLIGRPIVFWLNHFLRTLLKKNY